MTVDVTRAVSGHYSRPTLTDTILQAVGNAGFDVDDLQPTDLSGVDEFHLGGSIATDAVLVDLAATSDERVIDIGSGIGGPARAIARTAGCRVTGVDLTPSFVTTAIDLTARVGLDDRCEFEVADATHLDIPDDTFDAATMFHVGMNLPDKAAVFREVARVVKPGGRFLVYDLVRTGDGTLTYPLPWAADASTSFVEAGDRYVELLLAAGFTTVEVTDRTQLAVEAMPVINSAPLGLKHALGDEFADYVANLVPAVVAGTLSAVQFLARR